MSHPQGIPIQPEGTVDILTTLPCRQSSLGVFYSAWTNGIQRDLGALICNSSATQFLSRTSETNSSAGYLQQIQHLFRLVALPYLSPILNVMHIEIGNRGTHFLIKVTNILGHWSQCSWCNRGSWRSLTSACNDINMKQVTYQRWL